MERLVVVRCPELSTEDEGGEVLRTFAQVIEATRTYCPWVSSVRPGVCTLPARGPSRFFGGEAAVVALVRAAVLAVDGVTTAHVGVADGLFAAHLAAEGDQVVPAGASPAFLAPWPLAALARPELEDLLVRLGIRTLGAFAALPARHVLARFGADGAHCHRVASGTESELSGFRVPALGARLDHLGQGTGPSVRQGGFWGGHQEADARAARTLAVVQALLEPDAVRVGRRQGGRSALDQMRVVTWTPDEAPAAAIPEPWPGQVPSPAPALVYAEPRRVEVVGQGDLPVSVTGRGDMSRPPARLSVEGGPWTGVVAWAGPWLNWTRWWTPDRCRAAWLQVVLADQSAHLLRAQGGGWWLAATYD